MPPTAPRSLNIKFCLNGIIVTVGCQRVVFNDKKDFLNALREYLDRPWEMEKLWTRDAMFQDSDQPQSEALPNQYQPVGGLLRSRIEESAIAAAKNMQEQATGSLFSLNRDHGLNTVPVEEE